MGHLAGLYIKDADELIARELKEQGRLLRKGTIKHNYPFCWRSETPLIYKAVSTWFIRVTAIKEDLVANNHKAYWVPRSIQEKKFDNWLKDAKDWCFSRNRFWGNPIPLWVSDDGEEVVCVGSVKELEELTGRRVSDLHRENIDGLTIESKQGKGQLRRIEEVFDCWFESGSMPFAQNHYPFSQS
jgi:isoleucyl-tRNA synthetase